MSTSRSQEPWTPPVLRWAGSKRKLLPLLLSCVPRPFTRYIEPFAGSACLFFGLRPHQAVLGDINAELLQTYCVLRDHPRLLWRAVMAFDANERQYYELRQEETARLKPLRRAARFLYLNRYCFNGVYRTNLDGRFNVPRGRDTGSVPSAPMFYRCSIALRCATLRVGDFEHCLRDVRASDFIYLDPPYVMTSRRTSGEYGYGIFNDKDIDRLSDCIARIHSTGAAFLLSYADCPKVTKLLGHWHSKQITLRRHVAGFARHRINVKEVLISNRPLPDDG
jgi:DNA adenine methylase